LVVSILPIRGLNQLPIRAARPGRIIITQEQPRPETKRISAH
jgi:hypothetical protein